MVDSPVSITANLAAGTAGDDSGQRDPAFLSCSSADDLHTHGTIRVHPIQPGTFRALSAPPSKPLEMAKPATGTSLLEKTEIEAMRLLVATILAWRASLGLEGKGTTLGQGETEGKLRVVASFGHGEPPVKTAGAAKARGKEVSW